MTNKSWEKRYQFRLTDSEEDQEIFNILEHVPEKKRSEAIRNMLRYACTAMKRQNSDQEQIQELKEEMKKLSQIQLQMHEELMAKLESGIVLSNSSSTEGKEEKITEEAVGDTAMAMLTSFGFNPE